MDLIKLLSNPVRMQVMQYLQIHGDSTTRQISEALSDIPVPTLYRHINFLINNDLLVVKEEHKVRGSLERVLAVNLKTLDDNNDIAGSAYQYLMELYTKFYNYSKKPDIDPVRDKLSIRTTTLNLTDDEMDDFIADLSQVLLKYATISEHSNGKIRSISTIFAPTE